MHTNILKAVMDVVAARQVPVYFEAEEEMISTSRADKVRVVHYFYIYIYIRTQIVYDTYTYNPVVVMLCEVQHNVHMYQLKNCMAKLVLATMQLRVQLAQHTYICSYDTRYMCAYL
jgi:hypothetical protein